LLASSLAMISAGVWRHGNIAIDDMVYLVEII